MNLDKDVPPSENSELENNKSEFREKFRSHIKTFAILSFLFWIFLIIAVISYHREDIVFSKITISDLIGLIKGDPEIVARQATTTNLLGLLGAFLSDLLINQSFGYWVLIPLLLGVYISITLLRNKINWEKFWSNIAFWMFVTLFLSGFFGAIRNFTWLGTIPFEWCGIVGYFLAYIISSLIGNYGAFLLFLFAIFIVVFYKFDLKITDLMKYTYYSVKNNLQNRKNSQNKNENLNVPAKDTDEPNSAMSEIKKFDQDESENTQPLTQTSKKIIIPPDPLVIDNKEDIAKVPPIIEKPKFTPKIQIIDPNKIAMSNKEIEQEFKQEILPQTEEDTEHIPQTDENSIPNEPSLIEEDEIKIETQAFDQTEKVFDNSKEEDKYKSSDIAEIDELITQLTPQIDPIKEDLEPKEEKKQINISIKETKDINQTESKEQIQNKLEDLKTMFYSEHSEYQINYKFPSINNLIRSDDQSGYDFEEFRANARILQEKLETFKIYIENIEITPGPVVTLYEFVPAPGIKISRIESLADDIEMALKAKGVRIIAPMPGKGTVGVEIPNSKPKIVRFGDIVASDKFRNTDAKLPLAFGKTINGEVFIEDLTKMPHLLIAGATGTGKSVGINTIINSLLFSIHPQNLKFVIIDPKKVEMPQYAALGQHYLATSPDVDSLIITNPKDAVLILKSCVIEMENRYEVLADAGQRNISDYNKKLKEGKLRQSDKIKHAPMPYIVVIIDELADLMLTASKEIEEPITRLAQMARAVGIHLIVATQRPSVDVITGLIKANFPARLSYMTTSKVDSRTILDQQGAEQLLGAGDMLILPPGKPKPIRVQNAFITTEEVERICEEIASQEGYPEPYLLPSAVVDENEDKYIDPSERDPLFEEAARLVVSSRQASVSMLQRRMKIGFARAGRIMDELEAAGIVGSARGSKTREVLVESESQLEAYL